MVVLVMMVGGRWGDSGAQTEGVCYHLNFRGIFTLTATQLVSIPVFSVVWVLHPSWRGRGRAKQTTIWSPPYRIPAPTRRGMFTFRSPSCGFNVGKPLVTQHPMTMSAWRPERKPPFSRQGVVLAWQPRGGMKAGTRLQQTDGAASRDLPLLISLILIK